MEFLGPSTIHLELRGNSSCFYHRVGPLLLNSCAASSTKFIGNTANIGECHLLRLFAFSHACVHFVVNGMVEVFSYGKDFHHAYAGNVFLVIV